MSLITELRFRYGGNHTNYTPSRNPDMNVGHSTNYKGVSIQQSYGGKVYTNERFGKQLQWEFNYTNLSNADRLKLEALVNATDGRKNSFDFSPNAGSTYYDVRFTEDKLSFEQTAYGIFSVSFIILQEVS